MKIRKQKNYLLIFFFLSTSILGMLMAQYLLTNPKNTNNSSAANFPGDCDSDGTVNIIDFQLLSNSFGKSSGQSGYNAGCDFDGSNSITILDFQMLSNIFGRTATTNSPTQTLIPTLTSGPAPTFNPSAPLPAFPGAEGFGAKSVGGRGGKVFIVTNLNDSGSGSLRECVLASGPRTCVFSIGGTITLTNPLTIVNPYLTIAGQTAPGGGITIRKASGGDVFTTKTHDVIIRYITARPGAGGENHANQIQSNMNPLYNIIIDHNSLSWGVDSVIETWYRVYNSTVQWSVISEALNCSTHSKGCHSKGIMMGGPHLGEGTHEPGSYNLTVSHNLIAHSAERTPLVKTAGLTDVVNNVTYNAGGSFSHVDLEGQEVKVLANYVGNLFKAGPNTTSTVYGVRIANSGAYGANIYVKGNISPRRLSDTQPEIDFVDPNARTYVVTNPNLPNSLNSIPTFDAQINYNKLLSQGGAGNSQGINCSGQWFTRRDTIDARIVNDVINRTGRIIDDPSQVGGWTTIANGPSCTDTDRDGISDIWENQYFGNLNRSSSTNTASDYDSDGYTDLEEFLNGTSPIIKDN